MKDQTLSTPEQSASNSYYAKEIHKVFYDGQRHLEVLKGVDLNIKPGEMIAIVGKSGTGKTTLLQIIGTIDRPTRGKIFCGDEDILLKNDVELSEFRNRKIGFVFQFHHLLSEFTALENTVIPCLISGTISKKQLNDMGSEILAKVGLADRLHHKIGELSGGEQQRVAIARALIMNPSLLLADEPTGNLDPATGNTVFDLIREMNREFSLSTVMVTHNQELAASMDRCFRLEGGYLHEI